MNTDNILVEKCKVHKWTRGIYVTGGSNGVIRLNEVTDIRSDGINPHQVTNMLIELNYIHDFGGVSGNADHRDMLQVIGAGGAVSKSLTIRKNVFYQGTKYNANDSWTQTIWFGGDGRTGSQNHKDIIVKDNYIINSHLWGIGAFGIDNMTVSGNIIGKFPRVDPTYPNAIETPRISVNVNNPDVKDNIVPSGKVSSVDVNGGNMSNLNGNLISNLTPEEILNMIRTDSELAYHNI